ncbi:MAG: nucleotide exchange factor GrpE [Thermodesulfovibrionales bacterium]|nr:nucleotide exchange factor GrpE [Thermodesulfovibrionales bacterium]
MSQEEYIEKLIQEKEEYKDKYLRLYAEFDNYKRKALKDKEELIKYSNESILNEILPILDSIEMAIKHSNEASSDNIDALRKGVENTLRELQRTLEKFGVTYIEAQGKEFNPVYHHAMSQVERDDLEENTIVEEFRRGYMLKDKVIRPSLVVVSKKSNV